MTRMWDPADEPLVRAGLRGFLDLRRVDVLIVGALIVVAFLIRFVSPVFIPALDHPFQGPTVVAKGLGYPYNPGGCADVPVPPGVVPHKVAAPAKAASPTNPAETAYYCGFIFDEVYFPVDAAKDLHQPAVSYFDPEPPLTKLLMTPPLQALGFNPWSWRLSTAIFGSLLAGLMYLIAFRLRRDRFFATVAGALVCIDGLALVESRTGVIDIIAIFWAALLYYVFLLHWQARTRTQWRVTLYAMAAVCGLAFAAKLTALAPTVLMVAFIAMRYIEPWAVKSIGWLRQLRSRPDPGPDLWREAGGGWRAMHYVAAVAIVGVVFCASWSRYLTVPQTYWHFTACEVSTTGLTGTAVTVNPPLIHVGTLIGSFSTVDPAKAVSSIIDNMRAGLEYHLQECHGHPYASAWYTWPVMEHPVLFYSSERDVGIGGAVGVASITNMGNPAIWWFGLIALLFGIWRMLTGPWLWRIGVMVVGAASLTAAILLFHAGEKPDTVRVSIDWRFWVAMLGMAVFGAMTIVSGVIGRRFVPAFIVAGYELAWMMWVPGNARRVLFFYHALGMFLLLVLAVAYLLAYLRRLPWRVGDRTLTFAPVAYALLGLMVAAFIFFYPVWTAQPLPAGDHGMRIWVDTW